MAVMFLPITCHGIRVDAIKKKGSSGVIIALCRVRSRDAWVRLATPVAGNSQ